MEVNPAVQHVVLDALAPTLALLHAQVVPLGDLALQRVSHRRRAVCNAQLAGLEIKEVYPFARHALLERSLLQPVPRIRMLAVTAHLGNLRSNLHLKPALTASWTFPRSGWTIDMQELSRRQKCPK